MILQVSSIFVSILALGISAITAWLTLLHRGTVKMTRPSVIYFGSDGGTKANRENKIYLRTLLFSTSRRGQIIESMYVALRRNESKQNFNIWVYGDKGLVRGSGLYVGESGIAVSHHFLPPKEEHPFRFAAGAYKIEVFAKLLGTDQSLRLFSDELVVTGDAANAMESEGSGLYFDWGPEAGRYTPHVQPPPLSADDFLKALTVGRDFANPSTSLAT